MGTTQLPRRPTTLRNSHTCQTDKSRHTGASCNPHTGQSEAEVTSQPGLQNQASGHVAHKRQDRDKAVGEGRGHPDSHPFPPTPGRSEATRKAFAKSLRTFTHTTHTQGTRRLSHLPTRVFRESGPGTLRYGPQPALAHCAASPSASRKASGGRGPFRPGCPATGTQETHYSVPLHQTEYPRSSPATRRLAKTARAYMAPLHSAGCNADRQLIGRL